MQIENTIIQSLLTNPTYFTKTFSHFKQEHFTSIENQEIFKIIKSYYSEYQEVPKAKEIGIKLKSIKPEKLQDSTISHFKTVMTDEKVNNLNFLIKESQDFVQKQEFIKAILSGADAVRGDKDLKPSYAAIGEALKINFDADVGMEYTDIERRLEYYKKKVLGLDTGVKSLDDVVGGFRPKTLNLVAAESFGGKSAFMAHCASHQLLQGKSVLYVTLEMSEEETAKRIDANVLDININLFKSTPNEVFNKSFDSVKNSLGKLIIKEYPAGTFDTLMLESLVGELYNEKNFVPDVIFIDYITLMKSFRANMSIGTYQYYKLIAEELHSFSKRFSVPMVSAVQKNRAGYGNKESGLEAVADSMGLAFTADTFFSIVRTKELDELGQILITIQKNRNTGNMSSVVIGFDSSKIRYYDVTTSDLNNSTPIVEGIIKRESEDIFNSMDW